MATSVLAININMTAQMVKKSPTIQFSVLIIMVLPVKKGQNYPDIDGYISKYSWIIWVDRN